MNLFRPFAASIVLLLCSGYGRSDQPLETKTEARGYLDAARALMESKQPYDVTIRVEASASVDGIIVPTGIQRWRIRSDKSSEYLFFAHHHRQLPVTKALAGELDSWTVSAGAILIKGQGVVAYSPAKNVQRRKYGSHEDALKERHVHLDHFGLADLNLSWSPSTVNEMITRTLTQAAIIQLAPGTHKGKPITTLIAVLSNPYQDETLKWQFGDDLNPIHFSVKQKYKKTGKTTTLYSHQVKWNQDPNYGLVPVTMNGASHTVFDRARAGKTTKREGEQLEDTALVWTKFDAISNEDLGKKLYVPSTFEKLFAAVASNDD